MSLATSKVAPVLLLLSLLACLRGVHAQTFIHPGGLHSQADLDRMKAKVAAGAHPWIDDWNVLITDPLAQNTYSAAPRGNMGSSRQRADQDAHAAYLNALRWYISGDTTYAHRAVLICNGWSAAVNQVPTGTDIPGLIGIPIFDFALAGEVLRIYPGWDSASFARYKNMFTTYLYPVVHNFLTNHNGACISHYWANWDICNTGALIAMGVLCDDTAKYNEGVSYFENGAGNGNINNAVNNLFNPSLGQWQESGRDQEHAQLGVGMMAYLCQVAWNQGLDLFGYENNRLLAGAEYVGQTNLWDPTPFTAYNNCDNVNQRWVSLNGRGRLDDRPVWELIYNHYVVQQGLSAPHVQAMAQLMRPEHGSTDHFGYGTLTFTLDPTASPYPPSPAPAVPAGVTAAAGVGQVTLKWTVPSGNTVQGYTIQRATTSGGPYTTLASWNSNTTPQYTDWTVTNGATYYYVVAAVNQSGVSGNSPEVNATPSATGSLLSGWVNKDIGTVGLAGSATYAPAGGKTFVAKGAGSAIGGTADAFNYTYGTVSGDATITARVYSIGGTLSRTGVMIRESLDPGATTLIMKVGDVGWREAAFGARSTTGGTMTWTAGNDYTTTPAWFRLQRSGNTFTAYESSDGQTWFIVGTTTIAMAGTYYAGLAACSGSTSALDITTFDNVSITGGGSAPPPPTSLITTAMSDRRIDLLWKSPVGATGTIGYTIRRAVSASGPYNTVALGLNDTTWSDTSLKASTTWYYTVSASNLEGESAVSAPDSATTFRLVAPSAPKALTAAAGNGRIALSWSASPEATGYYIQRAAVSGGPYTTIDSTTRTFYTDTTTTNGTTYYYILTAVNTAGTSTPSTQVSATPVAGPYSYWPFDESSDTTATDVWGGRNGVMAAGATFVPGLIHNAAHLDGSSGAYVTLPAGVVSSLNDFTVATWVKLDAAVNWARLFDFGTSTNVYMFLTPKNGNDGTLRYAITTAGGNHEQRINSTVVLATGTWYHVAVTLSGSIGTLYVNGVAVGHDSTMTLSPSKLGSTTQNFIGRSQFSADPRLTGTADDFRLYGRALSDSEIAVLAAALPPVAKDQTITFPALPTPKAGDPDVDPGAFSSSGLPVTYTSSDSTVATIVNSKVHITGAGSCTIVASQPGDSVYNAAPPVAQTFTVLPFNLQVLYRDASGGQDTTNTLHPYLQIVNADSVAVNYSELKARYWFTPENYAGINTWIDYAQLGASYVTAQYVPLSQPYAGAFGYVEYSFAAAAGALTPGSSSGEIQSRIANTNWTNFIQANDYSYQDSSSYVLNNHLTLYLNGVLVWGTEPPPAQPVISLKAYYQNQNSSPNTNTISDYVTVNNEGNVPVNYNDLSVRYWFTEDGTAGLNAWVDYALLGSSNIHDQFVSLNPVRDSADTYFELKVDSSVGALYPLSSTGNIQYRIAKTDWSAFNETNDWSYAPAAPGLAQNSHITIYYKDSLIYGTEPASATSAAQSITSRQQAVAAQLAEGAGATAIYPNPVTDGYFYIHPERISDGKLTIRVYDLQGRIILFKTLGYNGESVVEVTFDKRPAPGVYFVRINQASPVKLNVY
ncbi:cellulose binding domain-containing protein [Puia dinghuensis]|uniref:T9SS C-terminal target domain-containing protein n=1 Tax=Puia dinghuensis TaxID=1792502 RepID=A0A8J2XR48_9BACT|nr:cellulose binding domain-containing protein [Puia dinghuensis]GGA98297.1 hypothetical protein GCM10011511_22010 [Puia dinghuensis]